MVIKFYSVPLNCLDEILLEFKFFGTPFVFDVVVVATQ